LSSFNLFKIYRKKAVPMVRLTRAAFKSFYDLSAKTLACGGFPTADLKMDMFKGKAILIQNVASL